MALTLTSHAANLCSLCCCNGVSLNARAQSDWVSVSFTNCVVNALLVYLLSAIENCEPLLPLVFDPLILSKEMEVQDILLSMYTFLKILL